MVVWQHNWIFTRTVFPTVLCVMFVCAPALVAGDSRHEEIFTSHPEGEQIEFFDAVLADVTRETAAFQAELARSNTVRTVSQTTPVPSSPTAPATQRAPNESSQTSRVPPAPAAGTTPGQSPQPNRPNPQRRPRVNRVNPSRSAVNARRRSRLARAPNMFGDFWGGAPALDFDTPVIDNSGGGSIVDSTAEGSAQAPLAFGGRRLKVAENNNVLPQNRVYVNYNHFRDAVQSRYEDDFNFDRDRHSFDIWTFGLERVFGQNNDWSVEFRLPLYQSITSGTTIDKPLFSDTVGYAVEGGIIGNLALIVKRVLYQQGAFTVSGGLGLNLPTGEDISVRVRRVTTEFRNQTVDLTPWIGVSSANPDGLFWHALTQLNVPLNGNDVNFVSGIDPNNVANSTPQAGSFGSYNLQTLLSFNFSTGFWLYQQPDSRGITGVASLVELHYTTSLNDADVVTGSAGELVDIAGSDSSFVLSRPGNRQDILNLTLGVHTAIANNTTVRFAQVVPLRSGFDRPAATESIVQVNFTY